MRHPPRMQPRYATNPLWMQIAYKMDTMGIHEVDDVGPTHRNDAPDEPPRDDGKRRCAAGRGCVADVGARGGLLSRGDLPSHEPWRRLAGRHPALRRVDQHDRAALDRAARRLPGDADPRGPAGR